MNDPKGGVAKVTCPTFEAMGQIPAFHRTYFLFRNNFSSVSVFNHFSNSFVIDNIWTQRVGFGEGVSPPNGEGPGEGLSEFFCLEMVHFACILTHNKTVLVFKVISITVSVSFLCDHFYMYIVSVLKILSVLVSVWVLLISIISGAYQIKSNR